MTGIIYHELFGRHLQGYNHVESPQRYLTLIERLRKSDFPGPVRFIESIPADRKTIEFVHDRAYVESILSLKPEKYLMLDAGDTITTKDSVQAAVYSAGAGLLGAKMVLDGELSNAFSLGRPPGHHAERNRAMGFCIFNNISITASWLIREGGISRVAIIDWDVHHGNGTENIFLEEDRVMYISLHQYPHYPGSGHADMKGKGKGVGFNLNLPMEYATDDSIYLSAFNERVVSALDRFAPEFILISAGFDAHRDDPLSGINLTSGAFREMTQLIMEVAEKHAAGRIVSFLEGGYNLDALSESVEEHVRALTRGTTDNQPGSR
ncbi:MAG: histone deacetylase [Candidatus Krumholzibacteriota bacterium]|nr:histone deacetylase [Candidatus Krumholzibacteriota bacterium]